MTEPSGESTETTDGMPFRLRDMELKVKVGDIHPIFERIDELRKQWKFMFLLAKNDWKKENYLMLGFGVLAFILGAVSADIVSGGDSLATGMEGITGAGSFSFFQMLLSIVCWVIFLYFVWIEFPVMRIHSITMMLVWNVKRRIATARVRPRSHSLVVRATGNRVGLSLGSSNLPLGA